MKILPSCILYSRDKALADRLVRIASGTAEVQAIETRDALDKQFAQFGDAVLLADLRTPNCLDVLSEIKENRPLSIVIVIGAPRSDPMLTAEWLGPFAAIGPEPDRREFQMLLRHAVECLRLRQRSRLLEEEIAALSARQIVPKAEPKSLPASSLHNFSRAQRNFDNVEKLFESVVDGLADTVRVSRAGIFYRPEASDEYVYQAGIRCLAATCKLIFAASDPFVCWLEARAHMVSRQGLENVRDPEERNMLRQALNAMGAEIILPLHGTEPLPGWIFVGPRATGIPFDITDLEELTGLADHISTTLEKALKYEETALQKALAETLLHSIPFGIVACDENGILRWFNSTARLILEPEAEDVIGQRAEILGSSIADFLRRTLASQEGRPVQEWTDPRTKRTLKAETRCLADEGGCVGAMMMLHDVTGAKLLMEKEEQLERAAFWTDLAASMSHEIRNPLVTIKTFAQLLPARYEDPDFRSEFGEQVTAEVDRLNRIIDKINSFADLPQPVLKPLDIRRPIESAVTRLQSELDHGNLKIHLAADDSALQVNGDAASLEECFYHLLRNSAENLADRKDARINVSVKSRAPESGPAKIFIVINDNGSGIDESVRDKLFSPFSTIKARGLGLGLPIAKRAVIDHNGQLDIETGKSGTSVTIALPALRDP